MAEQMPSRKRIQAEKRGRRGEWLASIALRLKGYTIVERGFRTKLGEIDIIARKGDLVVMVEVKSRKNIDAAINAVGFQSQQRIINTADIWLARQKDFARLSIRFDIVAILPLRWPKHFAGAF